MGIFRSTGGHKAVLAGADRDREIRRPFEVPGEYSGAAFVHVIAPNADFVAFRAHHLDAA
ncbi:MAG: hypothetical protein M3273_05190 [Actinomycetota bacterium]|nr:hypothetical protein [Actinomycetota bacterium]